MIYLNTRVVITDNTGGRIGECIKVLGSRYGRAFLSSLIILTVKKSTNLKKVKTHDIRIGIVVRMCRRTRRQNGTTISFGDNAVVLLDKRENPLGNRLFGPIASELVIKKYNKIVFMSSSLI